ncbi:hypothetical protein ILUMI_07356 [Ignelater luminosus]|uniref:HTH psq-type domain-containing protein n=1 Tax=Ignelater luminosus TaxID=2038154 RepID=A0A8K0D6M5_IGNLU|nr:hypothetical protein ILUMI_07356 [Ignelater luminosus]
MENYIPYKQESPREYFTQLIKKVRNRKRKSEIGLTDKATMMQAVQNILDGGLPVKQAAIRLKIPRTTLSRYVKKCKNEDIDWQQVTSHEVPRMARITTFVKY